MAASDAKASHAAPRECLTINTGGRIIPRAGEAKYFGMVLDMRQHIARKTTGSLQKICLPGDPEKKQNGPWKTNSKAVR